MTSFLGAILGYRHWKPDYQNHMLLPQTGRGTWQPGINYAAGCESHPSPGQGCHCGFNAYYSRQLADESSYEGILGAVAGSAEVQLHPTGFRSSQAMIIGLCYGTTDFAIKKDIDRIAERYGIPVFGAVAELSRFAESKALDYEKQAKDLFDEYFIEEKKRFEERELRRAGYYSPDSASVWRKDGLLHRDGDLPARIEKGGRKEWWTDGVRNRIGKPAIVSPGGEMEYWVEGRLHRIDGPAVINPVAGEDRWYKDGRLHRSGDLPAVVRYEESYTTEDKLDREYWIEGVRHRDGDKPAVIDGKRKEWWSEGVQHRSKGPAVVEGVWPKTRKEYWLHGHRIN